jgi:hypothetical protein
MGALTFVGFASADSKKFNLEGMFWTSSRLSLRPFDGLQLQQGNHGQGVMGAMIHAVRLRSYSGKAEGFVKITKMKDSSLSAAICRAIRFPGLAMMILLCVGAGSPRSEPSVSPPQAEQNGS